jgi:hypothetical protein
MIQNEIDKANTIVIASRHTLGVSLENIER